MRKIKDETTTRKYYDELISIGDNIYTGACVIGLLMLIAMIPAFLIGIVTGIICIIVMVIILAFGVAIQKYFTCIAHMAKNIQTQSELLENLTDKLDK